LLSNVDASADRAARQAAQRWRCAVLILSIPAGVVGPVDRPPWSLQRRAPRFVLIALHWQGVPRLVVAWQRILRLMMLQKL
jgi:hypothetical protein